MSEDFERIPPHDRRAEECVLGAMMLSQGAIADVSEVLEPGDYLIPAHAVIHETIVRLHGNGKPADAVSTADALAATEQLVKIGGAPYLHTLLASVPSVANAGYYARIVRELSIARHMIEASTRIAQAAWSRGLDTTEKIDAAYRALDEATGKAVPPRARSIADLINPALERIEKGPEGGGGVKTDWADLNKVIPGFRPGQMITVGARPGMGKSIVLVNVAVHAALEDGLPVLACSLEMSEQEYIERILAAEAEVSLKHIVENTLTNDDWDRLAAARERLAACPNLMINDDPYLTIQGIRSDLRTMRRAGHPAALVTVDYLQLMTASGKPESRQTEVSDLSRGLKLLAKEFDVPVLVGSQLNRGPEMRSDHRPVPADLRDSGSVEQDSDIVVLLYRDEVYEQESAHAGEVDFIIAKHRQGELRTVSLAFRGHHAKVSDMYRPWGPAKALDGAA